MTEHISLHTQELDADVQLATLKNLVGAEHSQDVVCRALRHFAEDLGAPVVGAHQITCSDESERECADAFESLFVRPLLPVLKFANRAQFRTANLGARYERGSIQIAEDHYATPASARSFKLLVVKLNTHVCVTDGDAGPAFGRMKRYQLESTYCGAIGALLSDAEGHFADELRELFQGDGEDRLGTIRDPKRVRENYRPLVAAIVAARLQVARIAQDVELHAAKTPTYYVLLPCVTLNRLGRDTEFVVGLYTADRRREPESCEYTGLGADPGKYAVSLIDGSLHVRDDECEG
jgi:hypothetical protein